MPFPLKRIVEVLKSMVQNNAFDLLGWMDKNFKSTSKNKSDEYTYINHGLNPPDISWDYDGE